MLQRPEARHDSGGDDGACVLDIGYSGADLWYVTLGLVLLISEFRGSNHLRLHFFLLEIQELRHKSQTSKDASAASSVIDQSLGALDERVESVSQGIKSINDVLEPLLRRSERTPTLANTATTEEEEGILRKHADLMADWDSLQKEIQVLREELKEDKWLTVFRTVTDQADGMMSSLEKAVNKCQVRE